MQFHVRSKSFLDRPFWRTIHGLQEARMFRRNSPSFPRLSAMVVFSIASLLAMTQQSKSVVLESDHVSICGSNLANLQKSFTEVGLTPDFGGPHGNGVT